MVYIDFFASYNWISLSNGVFWHPGTGVLCGDNEPLKIRIRLVDSGAGWTPNVTTVAYVHEVRLRISGRNPREYINVSVDTPSDDRPRSVAYYENSKFNYWSYTRGWIADFKGTIDDIFVECRGREYGSWIDGGGRSNSLNAGDPIKEPVFQVESILRDELGLTNNEIDIGSFDDVHTTVNSTKGSVASSKISLPTGSKAFSKDLIESLGFEWGFFMFRTHEGKMKVVNYLGTGDVVATLEPTDLISGLPVVRLSNINRLVNNINVLHSRPVHRPSFSRAVTATDTASQTAYGSEDSLSRTISVDTIRGVSNSASSPCDRLTDRLIDVEALLSRPHRFVKLATVGAKFADGELGDTINLNATAFDPVMKCMGDTWSGLDLMIISKEMTERGVTFDTIIWAAPSI